jgi:hypothetical protein
MCSLLPYLSYLLQQSVPLTLNFTCFRRILYNIACEMIKYLAAFVVDLRGLRMKAA